MDEAGIIRAWKDREFYESLTPEERAEVPEHPAGVIELTDRELERAGGARGRGWGRGRGSSNPGRPPRNKVPPQPTPQPTPTPKVPDWRTPREGRVPSWTPGY